MGSLGRVQANNLDLPICPKCNDTKHIKDEGTVPCIIGYDVYYKCTKCKINWYGKKWEREIT